VSAKDKEARRVYNKQYIIKEGTADLTITSIVYRQGMPKV
jgi:hypothetical protein